MTRLSYNEVWELTKKGLIPAFWRFKKGDEVRLALPQTARGRHYQEAAVGDIGTIRGPGGITQSHPEVYKVLWRDGSGSNVDANCLESTEPLEPLIEEAIASIRKAIRTEEVR